MDRVLDRIWTTETFLDWEDRQEGRFEFDGQDVSAMTGGSFAHQRIVLNLCVALLGRLGENAARLAQEMRLRIGTRIRYPDVLIASGPLAQTTRTVTDAVAIFEVLSDDTAATDRITKLIEYADVPSLRCYVLLEQAQRAAVVYRREGRGEWTATAHDSGHLTIAGTGLVVPLDALYRGLSFPAV